MMGGSCTNICYHNQMYLLLKRKRLNTVALRITEAKHIIAGASCVSVSIGAFWLSSQRCLRIGINVSNPIARERLHLRRVWLSSISIWRSWRWIFVTNPIIGVSPWGLHLLEMDLYATYLITRVHLLPRAAVSCAIVSNQACWLSSMLIVINAGRIIRLLIVITADCHHSRLSSLLIVIIARRIIKRLFVGSDMDLQLSLLRRAHMRRWWNQINSFSHKVLWPRDWLLRQPEFRLYREDSHGEDPAPPGIVVHFHARRQWSTRDITCNVRLTMVDPWYCATIVRFPVDRRSCEQGEYLDDVRSNRWQLGGNVIHNRRQYNCQLKITVAHEPWLTVICQ